MGKIVISENVTLDVREQRPLLSPRHLELPPVLANLE
jgi:hypothetical protein